MSESKLEWVPAEEPYDDYERMLLQRVEELRREFEAAAKPYIDELTRSRMLKPVRGYVRVA